ncbi:hypothetical protein B0H17DRAFT_1053679 [Mycena rosella]|uniref:Zn(2)-C6 fungal-type domain-containing protein n=1 Tax=Mycena rosella TaxID=1033263 RepID=A0AAD7DPV9_MYCRO|nr:hypothetical protein B0H17DRAFT_1053679 [Mycena rosella]
MDPPPPTPEENRAARNTGRASDDDRCRERETGWDQRPDIIMDPLPPTPSGSSIPPSNDPSWPRRTVKACSNCRRDKVRCDGEKPCSGCSKKNIQCLDGCEPCRRARARCEKVGDSCTRCQAEKIECVAEETFTSVPPPFVPQNTPPSPAALAAASERVKAACKNCKNDNKKCDNQRPCERCVARHEPCVPLERAPKQSRLRCEGCRKQNVRCDDARPCQNCITSGTECVNLARQGRGCGTRVKAACIRCRRTKIRCDGARPCGSCSRRGSECVEQACKRCARNGLDTCTHHPRGEHRLGNLESENPVPNDSEAPSTSSVDPALLPPPPPPASTLHRPYYRMPWPVSEPSMFAPLHPPGQGPAYLPATDMPNPLPNATSSTDPALDA